MDDSPLAGTRRILARVWSPQLENERDIDVFLPPSYARTRRRYPVIYMQDGQNLADPHRAFAGTWDLLRALDNLARRGLEVIVVGVPNSGAERLREYSPFADARHGGGGGDAYLAFVERTLKPLIDRRIRTRPEREATGIFGSSMGGLISLYSFFRASETFGFVGAMSPSLWFGGGAIIEFIEKDGRPQGRIYVDAGTDEGPTTVLDASRLAAVLERKGYVPGESMLFTEVPGGRHEEAHWAERLAPALEFLLLGVPPATRKR
ncbi:MAG: alpha/beta hydrolase-fold protein [Vicinamibacterales bacterium]